MSHASQQNALCYAIGAQVGNSNMRSSKLRALPYQRVPYITDIFATTDHHSGDYNVPTHIRAL